MDLKFYASDQGGTVVLDKDAKRIRGFSVIESGRIIAIAIHGHNQNERATCTSDENAVRWILRYHKIDESLAVSAVQIASQE